MPKSTVFPAQPPSAPTQALDQDEQEQLALINAFIGTIHHFFGGCIQLFRPFDPLTLLNSSYKKTWRIMSPCADR